MRENKKKIANTRSTRKVNELAQRLLRCLVSSVCIRPAITAACVLYHVVLQRRDGQRHIRIWSSIRQIYPWAAPLAQKCRLKFLTSAKYCFLSQKRDLRLCFCLFFLLLFIRTVATPAVCSRQRRAQRPLSVAEQCGYRGAQGPIYAPLYLAPDYCPLR